MSIAITTDVTDNATPALEAKLAKCKPERLRAILGPQLTRFTQQHLLANGKNKRGWPTTGFWPDAARATSWRPVDSGKEVSLIITINKIGVRQRLKGGPIVPVNAKALSIPISPVSYGHVPSDFPGLFLLSTKKGAYLVQEGEEVGKRGKIIKLKKGGGNSARRLRAGLNFLFKLSAGVQQQPDPSVVPSPDELSEVAMGLIERAVN